jgi:hypothetical protein
VFVRVGDEPAEPVRFGPAGAFLIADLDALADQAPESEAPEPDEPAAVVGVRVRSPRGGVDTERAARRWSRSTDGYLSVLAEDGRELAEYPPGEWRSVALVLAEAAE